MAYQCINRSLDRANVLPSGKAGAALAAGDLVYMDSSGNWQIAAAGSHLAEGIMESAALIYERVSPIKIGDFDGWSSQTIGAKAYLSITGTTGNTITATKPVGVQVQEIGFFSSATTLRVGVCAAAEEGDEGSISVYGSDGKFKQAYATIDLANAALAGESAAGVGDGDIVQLKPGRYQLTGVVSVTKAGVKFIGGHSVEIVGAANAASCFSIALGAITKTAGVTFQGLSIVHDTEGTTEETMVGIQVNNTSATARVMLYVDDCDFETGGGNSIDIDHAVTTASIRVYINRSTVEGPINMVIGHDEDRLRFSDGVLRGGLVLSAGDKDAEILLKNSIILHEGITGGASNQRLYCINCVSELDETQNVYAVVDSSDLADSCTDVIIQGTAS